MPIPFDMLAVMLFLGYYAETPVRAFPPAGRSAAVVLGAAAALLLAAALVNRATLALLSRRRNTADRRRLAAFADIGLRLLLVLTYMASLEESDLPWSLASALGWSLEPSALGVQILGLAPYILFFFCAWLPMYRLHREVNFGHWTRASFLVHKARYNLFVLLAWLPFAILAEWFSGFLIALPFLFLLAAWTFPLILARAWGCRRLTDGEVLDTVHRLEKLAGTRFSRVYLWEPGGGGTQNAAAVGIMPPFRFLFLTPALIRNMKQPELEGVILHELGHVKRKHLLFYLFTSLAGLNAAVLAGALLPLSGNGERFIVTTVLVLFYFRFVFGWLSRNMERQADLFALERSGSPRGLANALEKLGIAAGHIRLAESWHHMGIAERVGFLRRAGRSPDMARRHNAGVAGIMFAGYLVSACFIALLAWAVYDEYAAPAAAAVAEANGPDRRETAHWRRVMTMIPGNPVAPLELAYRYAGSSKPGSRRAALELADRVLRLACAGEQREAASKLIRNLNDEESVPAPEGGDRN